MCTETNQTNPEIRSGWIPSYIYLGFIFYLKNLGVYFYYCGSVGSLSLSLSLSLALSLSLPASPQEELILNISLSLCACFFTLFRLICVSVDQLLILSPRALRSLLCLSSIV